LNGSSETEAMSANQNATTQSSDNVDFESEESEEEQTVLDADADEDVSLALDAIVDTMLSSHGGSLKGGHYDDDGHSSELYMYRNKAKCYDDDLVVTEQEQPSGKSTTAAAAAAAAEDHNEEDDEDDDDIDDDDDDEDDDEDDDADDLNGNGVVAKQPEAKPAAPLPHSRAAPLATDIDLRHFRVSPAAVAARTAAAAAAQSPSARLWSDADASALNLASASGERPQPLHQRNAVQASLKFSAPAPAAAAAPKKPKPGSVPVGRILAKRQAAAAVASAKLAVPPPSAAPAKGGGAPLKSPRRESGLRAAARALSSSDSSMTEPEAPVAAPAAALVSITAPRGSTVKVATAAEPSQPTDDGYADVSDHGNKIDVGSALLERMGAQPKRLSSGLYDGYEGYAIDSNGVVGSAKPKRAAAAAAEEADDDDDDDDDEDEAALLASSGPPTAPRRIDTGAYDTHASTALHSGDAAAGGGDASTNDARRARSLPLVEPTVVSGADSESPYMFTAEDCARVETMALSELHARLARLAGRQPQLVAAAMSLMARGDATLLESVHRAIDRVALLAVGGDVNRAMALTGGVVPFRSHIDPPLWKLHVQRAWSREWRTLSEALQRSRRRRRTVRDDDDDDDGAGGDDDDDRDQDAQLPSNADDEDVVNTSLSPLGSSFEGADFAAALTSRVKAGSPTAPAATPAPTATVPTVASADGGGGGGGGGGDTSSGQQEPARTVNSLDTLVRLRNLANDFVSVAEQYGRIIISERHLPNIDKTIRPVGVGGVAGGDKYIAQGILFKFAVDTKISDTLWMYGGKTSSDENATRVAGNELRGLISYYKCGVRNLAVPLMALIDYRGYRLVACSLLPIGPDTLRYGSDDGGQSVHNDDPVLASKMRRVARQLHLKGHVVGRRPQAAAAAAAASSSATSATPTSPAANTRVLHGPGDIEGHLGRDGQYWVLDFARVFPPEAPDAMQYADDPAGAPVDRSRRIFCDLLRPELVRRHPVPLSSDAFSNFQAADRRAAQLNAQVRAATRELHERVIPEYADSLPLEPSWSKLRSTPVVEGLHSRGISVRHLGLVRSHLPLGDEGRLRRRLCLTEMCHRMVKNQLRQQLRAAAERCRLPSLELDRRVVLDVLNVVFALKSSSMHFWTATSGSMRLDSASGDSSVLVPAKRALLDKFGRHALESAELPVAFDLRREVDAELLIERLQLSMRIKLSERARAELSHASGHNEWPVRDATFELVDRDLLSIGTKVKHMNVVGFTTAVVLRLEAERQRSAPEFDRLSYDAYRVERKFAPADKADWNASHTENPALESPNRYGFRRTVPLSPERLERARTNGWALEDLQGVVDQFVLHYDVSGTSRRCFQVLHDQRGLSVHFMLDVDGTVYQTLDLKERAWHATSSNSRI
jgi:hypothetical protein